MSGAGHDDDRRVPSAVVERLLAADGPDFCRFLKRLYFEELERGHAAEPAAGDDRARFAEATALGLLAPQGNGSPVRMTRIGYEVGNVAKEYVNWTDAGRPLPEGVTPSLVRGRRVLDVGCSFGRHLMNFELHGADVFGIEFQRTYLQLSRPFAAQIGVRRPRVAQARAEQIPFRDESVDVVFCRLVLNYVYDIDGTIGEFARVLRSGGTLVLIVEPPGMPLRTLRTAKWIGNGRTIAFLLLGLLNTGLLALGGRQLVLRRPGRMHAQQSPAWPTDGWLSQRLAAHGFASPAGDEGPSPQASGVFVATLHRRDERASTASAPLRAAAGDRRVGR